MQQGNGVSWDVVWSAATVILTFGLLIVTAIYAWLTYRLVKSSEQQSWEMSRARLLVGLRTNQGGQFFLLHIENVGQSSAENLRLTLDRPLHQQFGGTNDIGEVPVFQNGLRSLPPHTPVQIGLGVGHAYLGDEVDREKHPLSFKITAAYESGGRCIREEFAIDVSDQYNATLLRKDFVDDFARTFPDKFTKEMQALTRQIGKSGHG